MKYLNCKVPVYRYWNAYKFKTPPLGCIRFSGEDFKEVIRSTTFKVLAPLEHDDLKVGTVQAV